MGFVIASGLCLICRNPFSYNPTRVPSWRGRWTEAGNLVEDPSVAKEPICRGCITQINAARKARGLAEWPVSDDAYGPVSEEQL